MYWKKTRMNANIFLIFFILRNVPSCLNELICYFGSVINNPAELRDLEAFLSSSRELGVWCFSFCRVSPVPWMSSCSTAGATIRGYEVLQLFNAGLRNGRVENVSQQNCISRIVRSHAHVFLREGASVALPLPAGWCWRATWPFRRHQSREAARDALR